ncbi:hypothetical protein Gogos_021247 [Gossypium gossypioides]|uniref:Uncharacterized protein n=1 Tax=Gossypium gossypioides TaxID=34282 RepID=A0A7J9CX48_GOSGO|nr:hypothetical protein [Gossypium gossypioides]MBA0753013.1 hypothetical protein [Gossypium gossypioides]
MKKKLQQIGIQKLVINLMKKKLQQIKMKT